MSTIESKFNGYPAVTDWDKAIFLLQQVNSEGFNGATSKEIVERLFGDIAIQGADFYDLPIATSSATVALPIPTVPNKFGFLANGKYSQPVGGTLEYASTQWGLAHFDGTKWIKKFTLDLPVQPGVDVINPTGSGLTSEKAVAGYAARKSDFDALTNSDNRATLTAGKYYKKSDHSLVTQAGWGYSQQIPVTANTLVTREGSTIPKGSSPDVAIITFLKDGVRLGVIDQSDMDIPAKFTFLVKDYHPTATHVDFSSSTAAGLKVYTTLVVSPNIVKGLPDVISSYSLLVGKQDLAKDALKGYYDATGAVISADNWRYTPPRRVIPGQKIIQKGVTTNNAVAVLGWNEDRTTVTVIAGVVSNLTDVEYTVPDGIYHIAGSARKLVNDTFKFEVSIPYSSANDAEIEKLKASKIIPSFMPKVTYARVGERITFNPKGIISKRNLDLFWNLQQGNQIMLPVTPTSTADITVELKYRDILNDIRSCGLSVIKACQAIPLEPAETIYVMDVGDSTVDCMANAQIAGGIINEVSRRLTGIGTPLLTGANEMPPSFNLHNFQVIGTRGDQPAKHEGRPGWGKQNYLNDAVVSGIVNEFHNPVTGLFDLDFYFSNKGFTGVNATGSNLLIFIQCAWNHVYKHSIPQVESWTRQLLNLIFAKKPACRVALVGLFTPPEVNYKIFTGDRNVSPQSIMEEGVIPYATMYQKIADDSIFNNRVDYLHVAHVMHAERGYPESQIARSIRDSTLVDVSDDYVHPVARGYAYIADVKTNYIINKYCKST